jgi:hypothetical protein
VVPEHAAVFDGLDDYVEVADHPDYSIATTGELTVVALIRPDSLEMPAQEMPGRAAPGWGSGPTSRTS